MRVQRLQFYANKSPTCPLAAFWGSACQTCKNKNPTGATSTNAISFTVGCSKPAQIHVQLLFVFAVGSWTTKLHKSRSNWSNCCLCCFGGSGTPCPSQIESNCCLYCFGGSGTPYLHKSSPTGPTGRTAICIALGRPEHHNCTNRVQLVQLVQLLFVLLWGVRNTIAAQIEVQLVQLVQLLFVLLWGGPEHHNCINRGPTGPTAVCTALGGSGTP